MHRNINVIKYPEYNIKYTTLFANHGSGNSIDKEKMREKLLKEIEYFDLSSKKNNILSIERRLISNFKRK